MRQSLWMLRVVVLLIPVVVHADAFTNGSFEVGLSGDIVSLPVGNTSIVGWEVINGGIEAVTATFWAPADGNYSLDLNGVLSPGGVQQTFDTISDARYQVTFALAGNPNWGPNYVTRVSAGDSTEDYSSTATTIWTNRIFTFTAISDQTTLSFTDLTQTGDTMNGGPALDHVRVSLLTPVFIAPYTLGGNGLVLTLALPTNGVCSIQATTNLVVVPVPWVEVANFTITATPVQFTDPAVTNFPIRYYRAVATLP